MRCSCRVCGTYMVQEEYGLECGCKCPQCGAMCRDCMGSAQKPMSLEELARKFVPQPGEPSGINNQRFEELKEEAHLDDWRKLL